MPQFSGARVALLEARMSSELAGLVRRHGGVPSCVPAVREVLLPCAADVARFIDRLVSGSFSAVVFLSGVGASALFKEAGRQSQLGRTAAALAKTATVCRGPKPATVLRRYEVPVVLSAAEPYTSTELLDVMRPLELAGKEIGLLHHGERDLALAEALEARGARIHELCLYEWLMPEDTQPLKTLVRELLSGELDAVAFTSQIQCRHLFQIATELGQAEALADALNTRTVVAAIGPVCAAALQRLGVSPHVVPAHPKMAPMIAALADHIESAGGFTKER